jgi:septal ring factor EnvC (AmiA/AmiB activator)
MYSVYIVAFLEEGELVEIRISNEHNQDDMKQAKQLLDMMLGYNRKKENVYCRLAHSYNRMTPNKILSFIERPYDVTIYDLSNVLIDYLDEEEERQERTERGLKNRKAYGKYIQEKSFH